MENFKSIFIGWNSVRQYCTLRVEIDDGYFSGGKDINVEWIDGQRVAYVVDVCKDDYSVIRMDPQVVNSFDEFYSYLNSKCSYEQICNAWGCNICHGGDPVDACYSKSVALSREPKRPKSSSEKLICLEDFSKCFDCEKAVTMLGLDVEFFKKHEDNGAMLYDDVSQMVKFFGLACYYDYKVSDSIQIPYYKFVNNVELQLKILFLLNSCVRYEDGYKRQFAFVLDCCYLIDDNPNNLNDEEVLHFCVYETEVEAF